MKAGLVLAAAFVLLQAQAPERPAFTSAPSPLHAAPGGGQQAGALTYAGGLYLTAASSRFGGFSGLEAEALEDGRVLFHAVTDAGDIARFTGEMDERGLLVRARDLELASLRDEDGRPFPRKADGDAEDISALTDRQGFLVSFEGRHRIVAYQDPMRPDGPQARVDIPADMRRARANTGIEAVAALPGGVVAVGAEDGRIWLCPRGNAACNQVSGRTPFGIGPSYQLSGFDHLANGELVAVYRAKAVLAHWNAKIVHIKVVEGRARFTEIADLRAFLGNMEGIAALPSADGQGWRIYLISDNAFDAREPTLLLAFDWRG